MTCLFSSAETRPQYTLKSESYFLSNAFRFPWMNCFLEGSQASHICPASSNVWMGRWWNDIDRRKAKYSQKNLSHCLFVYQDCAWSELGSNPGVCGEEACFFLRRRWSTSVRAPQRTQCTSIRKTNQFILRGGKVTIYCKNLSERAEFSW